jgi:hypothetical protein
MLFQIVCRYAVHFPFSMFLQMWVKPRKLNVSGLPSSRSSRCLAAMRSNYSSRVFSWCSPQIA